MKCRRCRHPDTKVLESRESKDGVTIRRRRECQNCGYRFTTFEKQEESPLIVIKSHHTKELYDRDKVVRSMMLACQKRDVPIKQIEAVADWIGKSFSDSEEREIHTSQIGTMILEALRHIDSVAYVRFASVYRAFNNVDDFMNELKELEAKPLDSGIARELFHKN